MRGRRSSDLRNRRVSAKALHRLRKRLVGRGPRRAPRDAGARSAPRRLARRRRGAARHDPAPARRRRDHAVRPRAARRAGARLHPPQQRAASARSSGIPTSGGAASSSSASAAATGRSTRSRSRGWRSSSSIRRERCTASAEHEREWLEYGALLHDIGVHISYERHHQHSYYLIKNGDLRGFEPEEIEIIALVARYHRQAHAEEVARGLRRSLADAAPDRRSAVGDGAPGRRARSQPRAGASPASTLSARRRLPGAAARHRRRRARAVGGAPPRRAARDACSASRSASRSPAARTSRYKDTTAAC